MKTIILFLIAVSICFGQVQKHHTSVVARKNIAAGVDTIPTFTFTDATDVALSSNNTGYAVVGDCDSARFYPASGDTLKDGVLGTYGIAPIWIQNGDTVYTPLVASGSNSTSTHSIIYAGNSSNVDTFTVTTVAASGGDVFAETFESYSEGDDETDLVAGQWTASSVEAGNELTVVIDTVSEGSNAIKLEWGGINNGNYVRVTGLGDQDTLYIIFELFIGYYFHDWSGYGKAFNVVSAYDGGYDMIRLFIVTGNTAQNPDYTMKFWSLWSRDDGDNYGDTDEGVVISDWCTVKIIYFQAGTSAVATLYIDDVEVIASTPADHSSHPIDEFRFGNLNMTPDDSSYYYIDGINIYSSEP